MKLSISSSGSVAANVRFGRQLSRQLSRKSMVSVGYTECKKGNRTLIRVLAQFFFKFYNNRDIQKLKVSSLLNVSIIVKFEEKLSKYESVKIASLNRIFREFTTNLLKFNPF